MLIGYLGLGAIPAVLGFLENVRWPVSVCRLKIPQFHKVHRTSWRSRSAELVDSVLGVGRCTLYADCWVDVNRQVVVRPQKIVCSIAG